MSQIMLYHNLGMETKYGKPEKTVKQTKDMSYDELKNIRDKLREDYGDIGGD